MILPAGNPVVTGTTISSTVQNNTMTDVANEITNSIPRDGSAPPTANIPLGGYRLTGSGAAIAATDVPQLQQVASLAQLADPSSAANGPNLVANNYALTYTAGSVGAALAALNNKALQRISVWDYMTAAQIADVTAYTFAQNVSQAIFNAQQAAIAVNGAVWFPGGGYLASVSVRYNKAVLLGDGAGTTIIKLPSAPINITSIVVSSVSPWIGTITTSAPHSAWVGKDVTIAQCATASCNVPLIVTSVIDSTHFVAQSKAFAGVIGTYGAALLTESNCMTLGACTDGNLAAAYSGSTIRGFTLDGNSTARIAATGVRATDTSDVGFFSTNFSKHNASDIYIQNCQGSGMLPCINSNDGYIQAIVDNCGAGLSYPGWDINSSSRLIIDAISRNCNYGARILDNCEDIVGSIAVYNATNQGFVHQNQVGSESHGIILDIAVETCGSHGVNFGEGVHGSQFRATVKNAGGIGCVINNATNVPADNIFQISTDSSQQQGMYYAGVRNQVTHTSRLDGRAGAAGSNYALDIQSGASGNFNVSLFDNTSQVRGVAVRSGAVDCTFSALKYVGTLGAVNGGIDDNGTRTIVPQTFYRAVAAASYTVVAEDKQITVNNGAPCTLTLPAASTVSPNRQLYIRTIQAFTVVSASANIVPLAGGAAATAILAATAGKWAILESDGANWQIVASN